MEAQPLTDDSVDALPSPINPPQTVVVIDGLRRGQVMGQQPPSTATADEVKDAVENLPRTVLAWASTLCGWRQMGLKHIPFGIGQVGAVCIPCHTAKLTK